jgi:hypothetical protein
MRSLDAFHDSFNLTRAELGHRVQWLNLLLCLITPAKPQLQPAFCRHHKGVA